MTCFLKKFSTLCLFSIFSLKICSAMYHPAKDNFNAHEHMEFDEPLSIEADFAEDSATDYPKGKKITLGKRRAQTDLPQVRPKKKHRSENKDNEQKISAAVLNKICSNQKLYSSLISTIFEERKKNNNSFLNEPQSFIPHKLLTKIQGSTEETSEYLCQIIQLLFEETALGSLTENECTILSSCNTKPKTKALMLSCGAAYELLDVQDSLRPICSSLQMLCQDSSNLSADLAEWIFSLIIANNIIPNFTCIINSTPVPLLHVAINNNNLDLAKVLIEDLGGYTNIRNINGLTPLHLTLESQNITFAYYLLNQGASVHAQNNEGKTALHYAYQFLTPSSEKSRFINFLTKLGADPNVEDIYGKKPSDYQISYQNNAKFLFGCSV